MGFNFAQDLASDSVLSAYKEGSTITIKVRVVDCHYRKPDTGFGIYSVENENHRRFKIVGIFASPISLNYYYEVTGVVAKKNGEWQLEVKQYQNAFPQDAEGILTVLRTLSGLNMQANLVYKRLGKDSLQIIHDDPEEVVRRIPGVSMKRALVWQQQLSVTDETERSIFVLQAMGLNMSKAKRLIDEFGPDVGEQIRNDPYFLMSRAGYLSFAECDRIALDNGGELTSPMRIAAAMVHVLKTVANIKGHCYLPEQEFLSMVRQATGLHLKYREAQELLRKTSEPIYRWSQYGAMCEVDTQQLREAIELWQEGDKRVPFKYAVYLVPETAMEKGMLMALEQKTIIRDEIDGSLVFMQNAIYQAECSVAASIRNIQNADIPFLTDNSRFISAYCNNSHIHLEEKQMQAVEDFTRTRGGFYVLQGPAGCGKTFTLNVILKVLSLMHRTANGSLSAMVLAPTGKAAKVASDATGLPAYTIHKALGLIGDEENPFHFSQLNANCVVIDEFSMVDIFLANKLLSSIPPMTKVIIMGDSDQLPSIGPGMVLRDIVESGKVHTVTLDVVKRQNALSGILTNANKILKGEPIRTEEDAGGKTGAFIYQLDTPVQCRNAIVNAYADQIRAGRTLSDVQVLCPQKMTEVGVEILNYLIQQKLFPSNDLENAVPVKEITFEEDGTMRTEILYFRAGDKVIHTENDYNMIWYVPSNNGQLVKNPGKKGIINGEMGIVCKTMVIKKDGAEPRYQVLVKYDGGYVLYKDESIAQLQHAYAMTIHKAQGSQWPIVIAPMMMCNYGMLARNLFYTLYTRAQETSIIYGQDAAVQRAIDNVSLTARKTSLAYRI